MTLSLFRSLRRVVPSRARRRAILLLPSSAPLTRLAVRSEGIREEFDSAELIRRLFTC